HRQDDRRRRVVAAVGKREGRAGLFRRWRGAERSERATHGDICCSGGVRARRSQAQGRAFVLLVGGARMTVRWATLSSRAGFRRSRATRVVSGAAVVVLLLALTPGIAVAQSSGDLDPTFGAGGKVTTDLGGTDDGVRAALQSDG